MKKLLIIITVVLLAFGAGVGVAYAALNFGGGYYVNLCGSGTAATSYSCNLGCSPGSGSCTSSNMGVVKWVCSGKWNQCFESESQWTNQETMGNVSCDKTVQISLFDKKCRREDGTWDQSCSLLGYMVWYSGECGGNTVQPTPVVFTPTNTPRVAPTTRPTNTPMPRVTTTPKPTITTAPTPTAGSKLATSPSPTLKPKPTATTAPAVKVCGKKCIVDVDCGAGLVCEGKICRNPACPADSGCFCGSVNGVATGSGSKNSPETGAESWLLLLGVVGVLIVGLRMRKFAGSLW